MNRNLLLAIVSCAIVAPSGPARSAEDPDSLRFAAETIEVSKTGEILSGRGVEIEVAGGTLLSEQVHFPVWGNSGKIDDSSARLEGGSVLVLKDGSELRFADATLDRATSRFTLAEGGTLSFQAAGGDLAKSQAPTTYGCRGNRVTFNGITTNFTSVCVDGGTRIWCTSKGKLMVETESPSCFE